MSTERIRSSKEWDSYYSGKENIVEKGNSTGSDREMGSDPDLAFSDVSIIIPAVVVVLLIVVVIIYYLWMCWEQYAEGKEEEKAAAAQALKDAKDAKDEVAIPIAEPEDVCPITPVDDGDADGTDGDIEDAS